jgi:excisionase family DNA binding protein
MDLLLLTPDQCAKVTGICRSLIEQFIREGQLPAIHVSGRDLIRPADFAAWVEALAATTSAPQPAVVDEAYPVTPPGARSLPPIPHRPRDRERWRDIWRRAALLEKHRYTLTQMVTILGKQSPDLLGLTEDTLAKIVRAGHAGLLD